MEAKEKHYFKPSEEDSNFCERCNEYFTHSNHGRLLTSTPLKE